MEIINTLGRRKTSVARVYLTKGTGKVTVNKKDVAEFFPVALLQVKIQQPFVLTETKDQLGFLPIKFLLVLCKSYLFLA